MMKQRPHICFSLLLALSAVLLLCAYSMPIKQVVLPHTADISETTPIPAPTTASVTTAVPAEPISATAELIAPRVLMYHLIREDTYGYYPYLFVRPDDFAAQLETLNTAGYRYLYADEYAKQPDKTVIITLDDGYDDNFTNLLPLLEQYDACATVFLITDTIGNPGQLTVEQIHEMNKSGRIRFGLHTASHADLSTLDEAGIRAEMTENIEAFTEIVGYAPTVMAYPYGRYNSTVMRVCSEYVPLAYTTDYPPSCTVFTKMNIPRYTVARQTTLDEFRTMTDIK